MAVGNVTQYAKHRGIAQQTVSKAIKLGKLRESLTQNGKRWVIDFDVADEEWSKNTCNLPRVTPPPPSEEPEPESGMDYNQARTQTEIYKAKKAKLDYLQQAGTLVEIHKLRELLHGASSTAKSRLLAMSPRLAAVARSAKGDAASIRAVRDEMHVALSELDDVLRSIHST